jgi:hypothetical protein
MAIVFHHGSIVRFWGVITGKLDETGNRDQGIGNKELTRTAKIYFGRRGLTGKQPTANSQ